MRAGKVPQSMHPVAPCKQPCAEEHGARPRRSSELAEHAPVERVEFFAEPMTNGRSSFAEDV